MEMAAVAENVALSRVTVAAFASQLDFTLDEIEDIRVAVSEAVTNAVVHAYGDADLGGGAASGVGANPGTVSLDVAHDGEALTIIVTDQGRGIADVPLARQPAYTTDPERMGLGFAIMESFSDDLDVTSEVGRGTTVRMVKRPRAVRASGAGEAAGDDRPV
ncbi:MAG: anti-sigma F factor [Bacillota bacterium]